MIDSDGYRPNVGIILSNSRDELLWARRIGQDAWQFPQGGIRSNETPEEAMYRELSEEIGLDPTDIAMVGCTHGWLRYRLPNRYIRHNSRPLCIGQKQVWFLLRLLGPENHVRLNLNERPEFDHWRWVDYWQPLREVVSFKRRVYECALRQLAPLLFTGEVPAADTGLYYSRPDQPASTAEKEYSQEPEFHQAGGRRLEQRRQIEHRATDRGKIERRQGERRGHRREL